MWHRYLKRSPSIEANFATRVGSAFTFHWSKVKYKSNDNVEDISVSTTLSP